MAPPPPPPPPPICLPFRSKKPKRVTTLAASEKGSYGHVSYGSRGSSLNSLVSQNGPFSPTATLNSRNSREKLAFSTDTESYDVPEIANERSKGKRGDGKKKWNWGAGSREKEQEQDEVRMMDQGMLRRDSRDSHNSSAYASTSTLNLARTPPAPASPQVRPMAARHTSVRNSPRAIRPALYGNDSSSTLVGSAFERKINDMESIKERVDTSDRLNDLRRLMIKDNLDY